MLVELRFSVPHRVLLVLTLLGATLCSQSRATRKVPIPPGFLRRDFALCESIAARTTTAQAAVAPIPARLKMIRERSHDESCPETAVSAPLLSLARALVPTFGPAGTPRPTPPHLRC
jgi:hypothetical protein